MTKPNNLKEYQQRKTKFAIQVLPTISKDGFIQGNHFFHERSGIDFKAIEVDQNLKLNELFSLVLIIKRLSKCKKPKHH